MSEVYRKTSAEELTAMADELRAIGPFAEDETFYFASEDDLPEQNLGVTKLIPKYGSTTVIERDGVCESWVIVDKEDYPYGVTKMRRPNYESYRDNTSEEPEALTFYIYGLDQYIEHDGENTFGLNDYIEVLNGYYTVTYINQQPYIGTGNIITVYDEEDNAIEKFVIVLYGDLNCNGCFDISDCSTADNELANRTWSTIANRVNYMFKAADIDQNGWFNITDTENLDSVIIQQDLILDQIRGVTYEEAKINAYYPNIIGKLGFAEAYKETSIYFYQKIIHATLTQEDIEGLILDDPDIDIFRDSDPGIFSTFPDITQITVTAKWLSHNFNAERLSNLQEVIVFDPENVTSIDNFSFESNDTLTTIKCSPTSIKSYAFFLCSNLIIGPDYLNIENCTSIGDYAIAGISQTDSLSLPKITYIGAHTFYLQNLSKLYLPDTPPKLYSTSGTFSNDIIFYVSTDDVLTTYSTAENWSYFYNNNRIKSLEAEAISNGSNQS